MIDTSAYELRVYVKSYDKETNKPIEIVYKNKKGEEVAKCIYKQSKKRTDK